MITTHPSRFRSALVVTTILALLGLDLRPALASDRPSAVRKLARVGLDIGRSLVAPLRARVARVRDARRILQASKPVVKARAPLMRRPLAAVLLVTLAAVLTLGNRCNGHVKPTDPASYEFARQATDEPWKLGKRAYTAPRTDYMEQHARFSKLFRQLRANPAAYAKDPPPELDTKRKVEEYVTKNFGYPDYHTAVHASAALDLLSLAPTAPGREAPIQSAIRRLARYREHLGDSIVISPGFGGESFTIPLESSTLPIPKGAVSVAKGMGMKVVGHPNGMQLSNGLTYVDMSVPQPRPDAIGRDI